MSRKWLKRQFIFIENESRRISELIYVGIHFIQNTSNFCIFLTYIVDLLHTTTVAVEKNKHNRVQASTNQYMYQYHM